MTKNTLHYMSKQESILIRRKIDQHQALKGMVLQARNCVMLDIETLGTEPGCMIRSIGAARIKDWRITETKEWTVDLDDCAKLGLRIEPGTVRWWMRQNQEAREKMALPGGSSLRGVLLAVTAWVGDFDTIWSQGASFDFPILKHCYSVVGVALPWKFWQERCFRTLKQLVPPSPTITRGDSDSHKAERDAFFQSLQLLNIMQKLSPREELEE